MKFVGIALGTMILILGSFFLGSAIIMWISDLVVNPFGLHGYNYEQAMKIQGVLAISAMFGATAKVTIQEMFKS